MKRETRFRHKRIANDLMYYIYTHIDTEINLDELANDFMIDKTHMHKLFKEVFGTGIYQSIKSIRLQKAANLLVSNTQMTISHIANACGYSSQTSFIRAFKERFGMTPKVWRKGGYVGFARDLYGDVTHCGRSFESIDFEIVKRPAIKAYYIRHRGYKSDIKQTWQKIQTWLYTHNITSYDFYSLFHDNPLVTPLDECQHIACVAIDEKEAPQESSLPSFRIAEGVYAKFSIQGVREDLLCFIRWVYHEWLPANGYEADTKPLYAYYRKNHHLSEDGRFNMDFYLSVRY